jgi:hypothetical protein
MQRFISTEHDRWTSGPGHTEQYRNVLPDAQHLFERTMAGPPDTGSWLGRNGTWFDRLKRYDNPPEARSGSRISPVKSRERNIDIFTCEHIPKSSPLLGSGFVSTKTEAYSGFLVVIHRTGMIRF